MGWEYKVVELDYKGAGATVGSETHLLGLHLGAFGILWRAQSFTGRNQIKADFGSGCAAEWIAELKAVAVASAVTDFE